MEAAKQDLNAQLISVADLLCDPQNPRIVGNVKSDRDAIRAIWKASPGHQINLAEDISTNGMMPFMMLYVAPHNVKTGRYVVLEGNRRTAALKALHSPDIVEDLIAPVQRSKLRRASKRDKVPSEVVCALAADEEIDLWIRRRHSGLQGGVGLVGWGPLQIARYRKRSLGEESPALAVVDFVIEHGTLDPEFIDRIVNFTNFERLVNSVPARRFMGLDFAKQEDGTRELVLLGPPREVVRVWEVMLKLVVSRSIKVTEIKSNLKQLQYLKGLETGILPDPAVMSEEYRNEVLPAVDLVLAPSSDGGQDQPGKSKTPPGDKGKGGGQNNKGATTTSPSGQSPSEGSKGRASTGASPKKSRPSRKRTKLIPKSCPLLNVRPARVAEIYEELQKIPVTSYRNSTAVLLRVFIELSTEVLYQEEGDAVYSPSNPQNTWNKQKLRHKVVHAIKWLRDHGHLTEDESRAAEKAFESQKLTEASISIMNGFVHNQHMFPDTCGLKTAWDNIQPFMVAIWNTRPAPQPQGQ